MNVGSGFKVFKKPCFAAILTKGKVLVNSCFPGQRSPSELGLLLNLCYTIQFVFNYELIYVHSNSFTV